MRILLEAGADPKQKVTKSVSEDGKTRKKKLTLVEWWAEARRRQETYRERAEDRKAGTGSGLVRHPRAGGQG